MKRRWKIITALLVALGILAVGALFLGSDPEPPPPGAVMLPDGTMARLEAVTYGTNHLVGPRLALLAQRLPMPAQIWMRRIFGRRASIRFSSTSDSPKLALWLNRDIMARPLQDGHCECVLADTNGFLAGPPVFYGPTYPLEVREFAVFPRRAPYFVLNIFHHDATGAVFNCGSMNIPNPEHRRYPQWQPDALPATKRTDGIEVTLEDFRTGLNPLPRTGLAADEKLVLVYETNSWGRESASACVLNVRSRDATNETWWVANAELSDATGNTTTAFVLSASGRHPLLLAPSLWPGEQAWKLKLILLRASGTAPEEEITFHNVPLGAVGSSTRVGWSTNCNGANITLEEIIRRAPGTNASPTLAAMSKVCVRLSGLGNSTCFAGVAARTDFGVMLDRGIWVGTGAARTNCLDIPIEAKTADFTVAVRQSRTVEFLVRPKISPLEIQVDRAPTPIVNRP